MSERLLIRIHPDHTLSWLNPGRPGAGAALPESAQLREAGQVIVLVPSEAVTLTRVALPPVNPARRAQVLPFALEDQVLDDVGSLHFVASDNADDDGRHAVAIVARTMMQSWLARLAERGIAPDSLLPDCLAVPLHDGAPAVVVDGDRALVRLAADQGLVCAGDQLREWLPADIDPLVLRGDPVDAVLARGLAGEPDLNLLQGDFAPRHRHAPQRRLWRLAALLAGLAILIGLTGQTTAVLRLKHANSQAEAQIRQRYQALFPDSPPVPDPVARVRSELQRLGGSSADAGLLSVLARAAPILASHDFRLHMLGLEYRNHTLELSVRAPDLANLDRLRERLATLPGTRVELTAATPGSDGVQGRLSIGVPGA